MNPAIASRAIANNHTFEYIGFYKVDSFYYLSRFLETTWNDHLLACRYFGMESLSLETVEEHFTFILLASHKHKKFLSYNAHVGALSSGVPYNHTWYWANCGNIIDYPVYWIDEGRTRLPKTNCLIFMAYNVQEVGFHPIQCETGYNYWIVADFKEFEKKLYDNQCDTKYDFFEFQFLCQEYVMDIVMESCTSDKF